MSLHYLVTLWMQVWAHYICIRWLRIHLQCLFNNVHIYMYILTVNCYCKRTYSNGISVLGIEHQDGCCCCPTRLTHFSGCLLSAFVSATRVTVLYAVGEGLCDRHILQSVVVAEAAAAFMHKIDLLANQNVCIRFCLMMPALTVFAHLGSWS